MSPHCFCFVLFWWACWVSLWSAVTSRGQVSQQTPRSELHPCSRSSKPAIYTEPPPLFDLLCCDICEMEICNGTTLRGVMRIWLWNRDCSWYLLNKNKALPSSPLWEFTLFFSWIIRYQNSWFFRGFISESKETGWRNASLWSFWNVMFSKSSASPFACILRPLLIKVLMGFNAQTLATHAHEAQGHSLVPVSHNHCPIRFNKCWCTDLLENSFSK